MGGKEGGPETTNGVTWQGNTMAVSDPEPNGQQVPGRLPHAGSARPGQALATSANMSPPRPGSVYFQGEAGSGFQVGVRGNNMLTHPPSPPPSPSQEQSPIQPSGAPACVAAGPHSGKGGKVNSETHAPSGEAPLRLCHILTSPPGRTGTPRHGKGPVAVTPQLARGELLPQHSLTATHSIPWAASLGEQALALRFLWAPLFLALRSPGLSAGDRERCCRSPGVGQGLVSYQKAGRGARLRWLSG